MDELYVVAILFSVLTLLLSSIFWYLKSLLKKTPHLPPGPRGLPILGYLPFLGKNFLQTFTDLGHKYGPIFKIYLGNKLCVVISSPSLVKEVVRNKDAIFATRDTTVAALVSSYGGKDIIFSNPNSHWVLMRKIFIQEIMSQTSLEASNALRKDVVRNAVRSVQANVGKPVRIGHLTYRTSLHLVMNMLWGGIVEGELGEKIEAEFSVLVAKILDLLGKPNVSDLFPVLARFDLQGIKKQMEGYLQSTDTIFEAVIAQYKNKSSGEIKREAGRKDFLQILLGLQKSEDSAMSISHTTIKAMLADIVGGGTDSTTRTVEWAIAELMNNPEVINKAQKELSEVVGSNNIVEEFHITKLKYLEAIIKETLRLYPPAPILIPKSPTESSTIGGYTIPKNTRVFINMLAVHRDPCIWDSPMEFRPERFFEDDGNCDYRGNHFHYLPFGSGRRICPGMPLAERMIAYLLASLLHSFNWKLPHGEKHDMSETFGMVLRKTTPLVGIPSSRLSHSNLYV